MEPTSAAFRAANGLRMRPVPEWDGCLVLDPERAALHELNLTSWLLLELAPGMRYLEIVTAYARLVGQRREVPSDDVRAGLQDLLDAGLLEGGGAVEAAPG